MAVTISSSKFSFIRFEPVNFSLPAYKQFDSAFQFTINGFLPISNKLRLGVCNEEGEPVDVFLTPIYAEFLSYKMKIPATIVNLDTFYLVKINVGALEKSYNHNVSYDEFEQFLTSDFGFNIQSDNTFLSRTLDEIVITYLPDMAGPAIENTLQAFAGSAYVRATGDLIGFHLEPHKCFRYFITDEDDIIVGRTNIFKVISSDRFTSRLIYKNNEDAFEFQYDGTQENIVRLPFYLSRPQWPENKKVYLKSNGRQKLLSASIQEQYALKTDHMVKEIHRFLKVALAHDIIIVDCPHMIESPVEVVNTDNYQPQWDEELDLDIAQGKSTITVASFGYRNSNCEEREVNCPAAILTVSTLTDTTAVLQFQYASSVKKILINYRKTGAATWESASIDALESHQLTGLEAGYDYDVKVASNCGSAYGDFGRIKNFRTTGITPCAPPNLLEFISYFSGSFNLKVNLPSTPPANMELLVQRPDGFTESLLVPTNGFTANPFSFSVPSGAMQNGTYSFRLRSKCSTTNFSSYANPVSYVNTVPSATDQVLQYSFTLYSGSGGYFSIQKNGIYVVEANSNRDSALSVVAGDTIAVVIQSNGYAAPVRLFVAETAGATLFGTDIGNPPPFERFVFTIEPNKNYYISSYIQ